MVQHVQVPTHIHGNTLDLVLSSLDDNLISSLSEYAVALSDHYLVEMNINITKHKQPSQYTVKQWLRNIEIDAFKSEVVDISDNIMIGSDISSCIELDSTNSYRYVNMHHQNVHASKLALILGVIMIFTKPNYIERIVNVNGE